MKVLAVFFAIVAVSAANFQALPAQRPQLPETMPSRPPTPETLPTNPIAPYPEVESLPEVADAIPTIPMVNLVVNVNGKSRSPYAHPELVKIVLNLLADEEINTLPLFPEILPEVHPDIPINVLPILPNIPDLTRPAEPEVNITPEIGVVPQLPNVGDLTRPIVGRPQTRPIEAIPETRPSPIVPETRPAGYDGPLIF